MADEMEKRKRGRPSTYSSNAERAKAWRQRQRNLIEAAKITEPVIVEKIIEVERFVEKQSHVPAKANKSAHPVPNASNLFPMLKEHFTGYKGEENAKRFRTNAAKAATAAREILALSQRGGTVPQAEEDFLRQAAQFFEHLKGIFHNAQAGAKRAAARAEEEQKAKHEDKIRELIVETFGTAQVAADVLAMGEALLQFDKDAEKWLCSRFKVERAHANIFRKHELQSAIRNGDFAKVARAVAQIRQEIGECGRSWRNDDETTYSAGWADFQAFRTNV